MTVKVTFKEKLRNFCAVIWPTYFFNYQQKPWLKRGTVDLEIISNLTDTLAKQGKTEEELYVGFFFNLAMRSDILQLYGLKPREPQKVCLLWRII